MPGRYYNLTGVVVFLIIGKHYAEDFPKFVKPSVRVHSCVGHLTTKTRGGAEDQLTVTGAGAG